jgi:hypothetical protein
MAMFDRLSELVLEKGQHMGWFSLLREAQYCLFMAIRMLLAPRLQQERLHLRQNRLIWGERGAGWFSLLDAESISVPPFQPARI